MSFICHLCGEEWEKHPATVVACPDCKAKPGVACKRPSGHNVTRGEVHLSREQAAVDSSLLPKCKAAAPPVVAPAPLPLPAPMAAPGSQMSLSF